MFQFHWCEAPLSGESYPGILGADPEVGPAVLEKFDNLRAAQPGRVGWVEDRELTPPSTHNMPDSIESHQPFERPQPKITVSRLGQRNHGVFWKPLAGRPRWIHGKPRRGRSRAQLG